MGVFTLAVISLGLKTILHYFEETNLKETVSLRVLWKRCWGRYFPLGWL